jgi:hypothetical protein
MQKKEQVIPRTVEELIEQVENYQKALKTAQENKTALEKLNQNLTKENIDIEEKLKLELLRENLARNVENIDQHIKLDKGSPQHPLGKLNGYLNSEAKNQNPKVMLTGVNRFLDIIKDDKENKIVNSINDAFTKSHHQQPQYHQQYTKQTIIIPQVAKTGILPMIIEETSFTISDTSYKKVQEFYKAGKYEDLSSFMKEQKSDSLLEPSIKVTVTKLEVSKEDYDKLQSFIKDCKDQDLQKFVTALIEKAHQNNQSVERGGVILQKGMDDGYIQAQNLSYSNQNQLSLPTSPKQPQL